MLYTNVKCFITVLGNEQTATKEMIIGMATQNELVSYIMKNEDRPHKSADEDATLKAASMAAVMGWKQANLRQRQQKWYERKGSIVSNISSIFVKSSPPSSGLPPIE